LKAFVVINLNAPHRRRNPLTGEWVLVSPHRLSRPWRGLQDDPRDDVQPSYDPECYLCPGNIRANGQSNPDYRGVHVFDNDFPALMPDTPPGASDDPFYTAHAVQGACRVICFSPDHARAMPQLSDEERRAVIDCWADQSVDLGRRYANVQVVETRGEMMGCSAPHPHGQIWATAHVPDEVQREDDHQRAWFARHGAPLLTALAAREKGGPRHIASNAHWIAFIPYWAYWPFELMLVPFHPVARLPDLSDAARDDLADILGRVTRGYDALFATRFPYAMGWHGAPFGQDDCAHWTLHAHYYPPLLRSATVRKFMASYELLAEPQRDLNPETAADMLRAVMPLAPMP
jgi:UDPglucose--hexose-1-phosphate uridylyltransferase